MLSNSKVWKENEWWRRCCVRSSSWSQSVCTWRIRSTHDVRFSLVVFPDGVDYIRRLHIDTTRTCQKRPLVASQKAITEDLTVLGFAVGGFAVTSCGGWRYKSRWVGDRGKFLRSRNNYPPLFPEGTSFPNGVSHLKIVDADWNTERWNLRGIWKVASDTKGFSAREYRGLN